MKKLISVFALVCLLFVLSGCESKRSKENEKLIDRTETALSNISEKLGIMIEDLEFAKRFDCDSMLEEIEIEQLRCEELKQLVDDLLYYYER